MLLLLQINPKILQKCVFGCPFYIYLTMIRIADLKVCVEFSFFLFVILLYSVLQYSLGFQIMALHQDKYFVQYFYMNVSIYMP